MSGLDNFVWNRSDTGKYRLRTKGWKIGHAKHARRVKTRDGFHQP